MKNLRNMILTLTLIAPVSTRVVAMDHAPDVVTKDDSSSIIDVKNAVEVVLAGCNDSYQLYLLLKNLLQAYSVDVLEAPLKAHFMNNPELVCLQNESSMTALHWAVDMNNEFVADLLLKAAGERVLELLRVESRYSQTALYFAEDDQNESMAKLLRKYS